LAWKEDGHRACQTQKLPPLIALKENHAQQEGDHSHTGTSPQGQGKRSKQEADKAACQHARDHGHHASRIMEDLPPGSLHHFMAECPFLIVTL
jgi:hypothetical protein